MTAIEKTEYPAAAAHAEAALETLRELQQENETGATHRGFMRARLNSIEEYEQHLQEELEKCRKEKESIHDHSRKVGEEFIARRRLLARRALDLLRAESGSITNRELLWKIVTEQDLAHYVPPEKKEPYVDLLVQIDDLIRSAHDRSDSLPVMYVQSSPWNGEYNPSISFGYTDPQSKGLELTTDNSPSIALSAPLISDRSSSSVTPRSTLAIPTQGIVRYRGSSLTTQVDVNDETMPQRRMSLETDLYIGTASVQQYVDSLLHDGNSRPNGVDIVRLLVNYEPELFVEKIATPTMTRALSGDATDTLLSKLETPEGSGRISLEYISSLVQDITDSEDYRAVIASLDELNTDASNIIKYALSLHRTDV